MITIRDLLEMIAGYRELNLPPNFQVMASDANLYVKYWERLNEAISPYNYRDFFHREAYEQFRVPAESHYQKVIAEFGSVRERWTPLNYGLLLRDRCRFLREAKRLNKDYYARREMEFIWVVVRGDLAGWRCHMERRSIVHYENKKVQQAIDARRSYAKHLLNFRAYLRKNYQRPFELYEQTIPHQLHKWQKKRRNDRNSLEKLRPRRYNRIYRNGKF